MTELASSLLHEISAGLPPLMLRGLLVSSLAIALVLLLRRPWQRLFGARFAPLLWALVPVALLALALPAPEQSGPASQVLSWIPKTAGLDTASALPAPGDSGTHFVVYLWAAGCVLCAFALLRQQIRFYSRLGQLKPRPDGTYLASSNAQGPAVIGLLRPRVVLPADFEMRYDTTQQSMILCHERSHVQRGDVPANALASALRCIYWFNPLVHYAADRLRHDHELAADAAVVSRYPQYRKTYAETLLKVQLAVPGLPVGCMWQSSHPLKERIAMLKAKPNSRTRNLLALSLSGGLILATASAVWATQPAQPTASTVSVQPEFAAHLQLEIDGEASSPILGFRPGSDFVVEKDGWRISGLYRPGHAKEDLELLVNYRGESVTIQRYEIGLSTPFSLSASAGSPTSSLSLNGRLEKFDPALSRVGDNKSATYRRLQPPKYPQSAIDAGVSGWVLVRALVGADGIVQQSEVERSSPAGVFDEVSLAAVSKWTFDPALSNNEAVAGWVQVPICFSLKDDDDNQPCQVPESTLDTITLRPNKS